MKKILDIKLDELQEEFSAEMAKNHARNKKEFGDYP